jgi:hypothetical protein
MWNFEAPSGTGDTYNALLAGTKASIRINQNEATKYIEELYVERNQGVDQQIFDLELKNEIVRLQKAYPSISLERINDQKYHIVVPIESRSGHEIISAMWHSNFFNIWSIGICPSGDQEYPYKILHHDYCLTIGSR